MRDDERISRELDERLHHAYLIDPNSIEYSVQDGVVMLGGEIEQWELARMIQYIAEQIAGVKKVKGHLRVRAVGGRPREALLQ